jgi:hypothetical protein
MNMISFAVRKSTPSVNLLHIAALLIGLFLVPTLAFGQTFLQVNNNPVAATATTVTVTYTTAETAGNLNVVVVGWNDTSSSVVSVTDNNTNTYKLAGTTAGHGLSQAIYYAPNIAITPQATPAVTVTFNQPAVAPDVRILEYSGLSTTFPLDNWTGITANSATADSGPTTTTGTGLILGAGTAGPGTGFNAPGATFTQRVLTVGFGDIVEDLNAASPAGSYNATAALSPAGTWVMQVAGFSTTPITFAAPVIDAVTPISRPTGPSTGGTQVTIFGSGFQPGSVVFFGTGLTRFSAVNCAEDGGDTISCFTPAHLAGAVDVTVVNVDGQSSTAAGAYTFVLVVPPTITVPIAPATGPTNGATPITITGTQFQNGATVNVGSLPASNVVVTATSITAITPALPAGVADVTVINPDGGTATASDGFTYALGSGPINYIQGAATATGGALTTVAVTMPNVQAAGNLNVVIIGWNDTTTTVSSVADTEGNTYAIAAPLVTGTGLSQIIYFAKSIVGEASNPNEVTVTFSGAAPAPDVRVLEYKGLDIANPLDVTAGASGTSNLADSGACTTTTATELVVAGATVASSVSAPGTGFTTVLLTHPNGDNAEHQITSAIGSCQATAVVAGGNWVMQTVAFKAAAGLVDFTLNATNFAPPSVAAGIPATSTVTVAPLNGFNSDVALSCSITPVVTPPPTCAFVPTPIPGGSGTSVLTLNTSATTPAGGYTVTVSGVGGSITHTKVLSLTVTAAVAPDFTIGATALAPATLAAGTSSTSTISIAPVNGFTAAVALTCTVAPAATRGPTCAFGPASVTGGTGNSTLTVSTTAATTASLEPRSRGLIYAMLFPIGGLALLGTGITSRKKKLWGFLLGCILFSTLIILPACGGGNSSGGGGGGGGHPGTPAGVYTVTVTGTSGSLTHAVTPALTVTVN